MTTEGRQTVAGAYARMETHEEVCATRWAIVYKLLWGIIGAFGLQLFGLLGWMAIQLYTLEPLRVAAANHSVSVSVEQPAAPRNGP